jgi:hypothetical protein
MPYFKNENINILFIHIPKTGGTSIERYFSYKFNILLDNASIYNFMDQDNLHTDIKFNVSLQHITFKQLIQYNHIFNINFNNIKIITIVRNPYERIMSDLFWKKQININTTKKEVFLILQKYIRSNDCDNHNIPQYMFVTDDKKNIIPKLYILRTETLTKNMIQLGYTDFNCNDNKNKNNVNYYDYLNSDSINLINTIYHYDFILFNYKKIQKGHLLGDNLQMYFFP